MSRKRAWLFIPTKPLERFKLFETGLMRLGFKVIARDPGGYPDPDDVLVIWNRGPKDEEVASRFDMVGAPVIVCENGYVKRDAKNRKYFAMSLDGHNGSGRWPEGGPERWLRMEVELKPMQGSGDWILLILQRGIGAPGMAMPDDWPYEAAGRWRDDTGRHVEIRKPPSRDLTQPPLEEHLEKAHAVLVWTSNVATSALAKGVPVYFEGPTHILEPSLLRPSSPARLTDRLTSFQRMSWAQWNTEEILEGEPFDLLLRLAA